MKYRSIFEIIGPVMVGPSSSHTAAAVRIGLIARKLFGAEPKAVEVLFYGSFAETFRGHATDVAVIGGLLNYETDDPRIREAFRFAKQRGIAFKFEKADALPKHPNTMQLTLSNDDKTMVLTGVSLGGGTIEITEIDGFSLRLSGEHPSILIFHKDAYGTIASVSTILMIHKLNIGHMEVSRKDKGSQALMVIETDQVIPESVLDEIRGQNNIHQVVVLNL